MNGLTEKRSRNSGPATVDPVYWLAHCDGFRAHGPEGWIGTVMHIRTDDDGIATSLVVRTGLFRIRYLTVPAGDVDQVEPWRRTVVLGRDPRASIRARAPRRHRHRPHLASLS